MPSLLLRTGFEVAPSEYSSAASRYILRAIMMSARISGVSDLEANADALASRTWVKGEAAGAAVGFCAAADATPVAQAIATRMRETILQLRFLVHQYIAHLGSGE